MKVEFLKKFLKGLDDLKSKPGKESLIRLIEAMESIDSPEKKSKYKEIKRS